MWSTRLASEALSPPAGDGDRVFMRTGDGKVYGLEAATGTEQWMVDRTVPSLTLRGLSAPVVVGNRVYVGLDNGRVLALRTSEGQVAWEQVVSGPTGRNEDRKRVVLGKRVSVGVDIGVGVNMKKKK